ncbi:nucleoside diphosphate kinase regulator [Hansschlegelia zhihuaiae]|uniref:nucleoside diphosphate kinase regulator n=1 Tax=Hansschlegelia zhihuaiae TaxID=405005 RepID=UPI0013E8B92C|nr:nucleoside diphosphate kinase regulator [Hansschlegelia zhihuaiae]
MSGRSVTRKPKIALSTTDHDRLSALAATISRRSPDIADALQTELSRGKLVADHLLPDDVVRMGSTVTYQVEEAAARTVKLVYPAEADIDAGRVSVLTPIGTALLGLSPGQTMPWMTTSGDLRRLLIVAVRQDASDRNAVSGAERVARGFPT